MKKTSPPRYRVHFRSLARSPWFWLPLVLTGVLALAPFAQFQRVAAQDDQAADRALAGLIRQLADRTANGLSASKTAAGGVTLDLKGHFQSVPLAQRQANGSVTSACVETLAAAKAFFGRDLETGAPLDTATAQAAQQAGLTPQQYRFYQSLIEAAAQRRALNPKLAAINISNGDGAGEGFNDPAPRAPEGGNSGTTLGQQRLNLFNQAAAIWSAFVDSSVPISISAQFNPLSPCSPGGGVLGAAGANGIHRDFAGAPFAGTWYHAALANKLSGSDLGGANAEIGATFNSDIDSGCLGAGTRFYYGLDGANPAGTVNLLAVLLHEIGHGLGFSNYVNTSTGALNNGFPDIYTRFMYDRSAGLFWHQMSDAQRLASSVNSGNVLWDGANVRLGASALSAGHEPATGRVQLFAPNPVQPGSSLSHWDTAATPNLLMEPYISSGLPLDLDLTRQQMRDLGWYRDTTADLIADTITNVSPNSGSVTGGTQVNISWTNNGGFNRNVTLELSTDGGATFPTVIAANAANNGAYLWTVPNAPTTQARVRVREHNFAAPAGMSSANFTIVGGCPALTVNPTALTAGTAGSVFSQTFTQTGGAGAITWSHTGTLPSGLTLNAGTGVLAGTPAAAGNYSFTLTATDATNCAGSRGYTLAVNCPAITLSALGGGGAGTAYNQSVTATPTGTYSFTVTSGALPNGLTLNGATGALTGTPTVAGTFNFTITATGFGTCTGSRAYALTIACPTVTVTPATLPGGATGVAYSQTVAATPAGAYSFAVTNGALPNGVALNSATGALTGTPTTTGTFNFTISAIGFGTCAGSRAYSLTITCAALTINPASLASGFANVPYSQTFTQTGGSGALTYALSGTLPLGLSFNTTSGALSGTPTQGGVFAFTVSATDANNCTGSRNYALTLNSCPAFSFAPGVLPAGTAQAAYSQALTAGGGVAPYSYTVSAGALPNGLTLASNGLLSGTPAASGSVSFTVRAIDATGCASTQSYTLAIGCTPITVNPATLPAGTVNAPYSQTLTQSGGAGALTYTVLTGALPNGLTLSSAGALAGTPVQSGAFNLTISVTDASGCSGIRAYTLTINCQTISVGPASLSSGMVNVPYSQTFTHSSGVGAVGFSVSAGTLPNGLTLSSGGLLSGTPAQSGTFTFTIRAADANGCAGTAVYTLTMQCPAITINPVNLPSGLQGFAYSQSLSANGGAAPYSFAVLTGALPLGLTLAANGLLSGTPSQQGSFSFTVTATDNNGCAGSRAYTLVIGSCPLIALTPVNVPAATIGAAYSQALTANGGAGPYSFAVSAGALPSGLTVTNGGLLSGTPTQTGSFNFTVRATDNNGCAGTHSYALTVNCPAISLNPATLPSGMVNAAYSQSLTQSGGAAPVTFSLGAGALPNGVTLASGGVLNGTPSAPGTFNFTVRATDANNCSGTQAYSLTINCQNITVNPATLAGGQFGQTYSQTLTPTGGVGAVTFSVSAGALPNGLALSSAGLLSGVPTQSGSFPLTLTATDANGCQGTRAYTLVIGACPALTINPATLPGGTPGTGYNQTLTATGGSAPYSFSLQAGSLPPGLSLAANGALSGTPNASGTFSFTARVTDANNCAGARSYTLAVSCPALTVTPNNLPNGRVNQPYPATSFAASGGVGPYSFALSAGALPAGLNLFNGTLAGTPTQAGDFSFTLTASNAAGCSGARGYTLSIKRSFVRADFDGDGRTDLSVWQGATGAWQVISSGNGTQQNTQWGAGWAPYFDVIVPGDYDGDGKADQAIWRGQDSLWYIKKSSDGQPYTRLWGANYAPYFDVPVPGDYDGDGKTDLAVWRPTDGIWYVLKSSDGGFLAQAWGSQGDTPVPGDYDGDGTTDFACWRSGTGTWLIKLSSGGTQTTQWGAGYAPYFDVPVPADYDGDGKTDPAIWRGQDSLWYIRQSSTGLPFVRRWGANYGPYFDVPAPADYDGDGKADIAVWRPAEGMWYILRSAAEAFLVRQHGQQGDTPVPAK